MLHKNKINIKINLINAYKLSNRSDYICLRNQLFHSYVSNIIAIFQVFVNSIRNQLFHDISNIIAIFQVFVN